MCTPGSGETGANPVKFAKLFHSSKFCAAFIVSVPVFVYNKYIKALRRGGYQRKGEIIYGRFFRRNFQAGLCA